MKTIPIAPLAAVRPDREIEALPKADLHLHQEWSPRLDRVLARREGRPPFGWRDWAGWLMDETPPGMPRLARLGEIVPAPKEADDAPENFVARVEEMLAEAARDGAVLVEARFGGETALRPDFMALFHEAERRVRGRYPRMRAEAVVTLLLWYAPERLALLLDACLRAARAGLGGIDLLYNPYDTEAEWEDASRLAARVADAGLGLTAHVGEFSTANIAAVLALPGLTRIGHAVHAARDPWLLDRAARSGVTIECCLSCNVVLGAVSSYEEHPIRQFTEHGIPVALGTDDPVQVCTTIGREYAIAAALGFSPADLLGFTTNALHASFAPTSRKEAILAELRAHQLSLA